VVKEGDAGDIGLLDNNALFITRQFNTMVDKIVELTQKEPHHPGSYNNKCTQAV